MWVVEEPQPPASHRGRLAAADTQAEDPDAVLLGIDRGLEGTFELDQGAFRHPALEHAGLDALEFAGSDRMARASVLAELIRHGAEPPDRLRDELGLPPRRGPRSPCVVGLVIDRSVRARGLVTRLRVDSSGEGHREVPANLPFDAERLIDLLRRLVDVASPGEDSLLPEALAFRVAVDLGLPMEGRSMDVTALIGVVGALQDCFPKLLDRATSLVAPLVGTSNALGPSEAWSEKLDAFEREIERGGLVVAHPSQVDDRLRRLFGEVWTVESLDQLAARLDEHGFLERLRVGELGHTATRLLRERFERLVEFGRFPDAVQLAERIQVQRFADEVPRLEVVELTHLGRHVLPRTGEFAAAAATCRSLIEGYGAAGDLVSSAQLADAYNMLAAALYGQHEFEAALAQVRLWCEAEPIVRRGLPVDSRVWLLNTASRCASVLGRTDEALAWIDEAADLAARARLRDNRTASYRIEALIRAGRVEQAAEELRTQPTGRANAAPEQIGFDAFYGAEISRRRGERWADERMDQLPDFCHVPSPAVRAYYHQAVARQAGRSDVESAERLARAARLMSRSANPEKRSLAGFLAEVLELAAAVRRSTGPRPDKRVIASESAMRDWYGSLLDPDRGGDEVHRVERLIERVPWFLGGRSAASGSTDPL